MAQFTVSVAIAAATALVTVFVAKFLSNRQHVRRLQAAKVPMPIFHTLFGHLLAVKQAMQGLPEDVTMHSMVQKMAKQFPSGNFYLNLWPFSKTLLVIANPTTAVQVEAAFLDKPAFMCETMEVINGGPSLMTMHGDTWRKWRSLFNPGFAPAYMTGFAPSIVDEITVLCKLLQERATKGEVFQLEEYTLKLTFDVISRITFGTRLHYQSQGSVLADGLRRLVYWTPYGTTFNPFRRYLSPRPLVQWYNSYCIDRYLSGGGGQAVRGIGRVPPKYRGEIAYLAETGESEQLSKATFKKLVLPQLRMFLYAGHDTTSSTLLYCYHLLSTHPQALGKVRAEHDEVFGTDFSYEHLQQMIAEDPALLNRIPYTLAVIKEVLRVFPPAGSLRAGRPGLVLTDDNGRQYPTEDCHLWTLTLVMHHSEQVFVRAEEFLPERWLVGPDDPLHPAHKGSWRPFEYGPRACIGQTLAQLELKVALVMTVRMFDITPAYDEWDTMHPRKAGSVTSVEGNRVYQAEMGGGGAHPVDGFPVRVTLRRNEMC
ncbi:aflN/ verA/ monooxygenase [Apiospora kogelbergensis]|uniref:aflN/ verA/ monooxygenase n=1 Tax=Apiospora kogelbergensis TaxID=1337665 RepID=UPI003130B322